MARPDLSIDRITRSRRNVFASVRLDRLVEYRDSPEWVENALHSDAARFVPLWRNRNLLADGANGQVDTLPDHEPGEAVACHRGRRRAAQIVRYEIPNA